MHQDAVSAARSGDSAASSRVHLNNAGASLMPSPVADAVKDHLNLECEIGGYEAAALKKNESQRLYSSLAALLGCTETEIAFADSGTRAWNAVLYAIDLEPGHAVVTTQPEFGSNVVSLVQHCQRTGAELRVVRCTPDGRLDLEDLELKIDGRVKLVAATHTAAHRGYCAPTGLLSKAAREVGAFFLLDSCQAIGQMPVDVKEIGCHALVGTGRKWLRAPRGTAFLYVAEELPFAVDPVTVDLAAADFAGDMQGPYSIDIRSDGKRFELWERSVAAASGRGAPAAPQRPRDPPPASARHRAPAPYPGARVEAGVPDAEVLYDAENSGGIVGVAFNGTRQPDAAQNSLAQAGINVSLMADYDAPWDYAAMGRTSVMRIAPHYFNEQAEINRLVDCLAAGAS